MKITKQSILLIGFLICLNVSSLRAEIKTDSLFGTWGHGLTISKEVVKSMPFIRGWNFTFRWKDLEPRKGEFNWKFFDEQIKIAADNNLSVGFMVWVGQHSPTWVYSEDGVTKVTTIDKKHTIPFFPFYLDAAYKKNYLNLITAITKHLETLQPEVRKKVLFWMSAEGSSGDVTPYKGMVADEKFAISDAQWLDFKAEAWKKMYRFGQTTKPQINILINPANNGQYFDYLVENFPKVWFKAGSLAHTYQFDDELDYYKRMLTVVRPDNNGMANRYRSESEEVQELGWFQQSPQQNMFALVASCLHFGLDILNVREGITKSVGGNNYPFYFFNRYAGQRNASESPGAFTIFRDVLDVADTVRFPVKKYGRLNDNPKPERSEQSNQASDGEEIRIKRARDISPKRKQNILKDFIAYGAQDGPSAETEARIYENDHLLEAKLKKENLRSDLQDKFNNDMGLNLVPGNYEKFLTQYSPSTTSRSHWRIGPTDQPYGRYARGFDHASGMREMFFSLDRSFFGQTTKPKSLTITVVYFDKGNGEWALNYFNGKSKTKKYRVKCSGSNQWIAKTIQIDDAVIKGGIIHDADFSLEYLKGDNTLFSMIEVLR